MNLYIVGNGFDLAHDLKTSYTDFKSYMTEHRDEVYEAENLRISKEEILKKFEEYCKPNYLWSDFEQKTELIISEISDKKLSILGEEWNCKLGIPDERYKFIDKFTKELNKLNNLYVSELTHKEIQNIALSFFNFQVVKKYLWIPYLYISFQEWIQTIEYSDVNKIYNIKGNSAVLSFNYTETMTEVYGKNDKDILYIHGSVKRLDDIVLGFHSSEIDIKLPGLETTFTDGYREEQRVSMENGFTKLISNTFHDNNIGRFYKPVNILKDTIAPFIRNHDINKVIVLGHSYNTIDWIYFKEIVNCIPEAKYLFTYYSPDDEINIQKMISDNKFDIDYKVILSDSLKLK